MKILLLIKYQRKSHVEGNEGRHHRIKGLRNKTESDSIDDRIIQKLIRENPNERTAAMTGYTVRI